MIKQKDIFPGDILRVKKNNVTNYFGASPWVIIKGTVVTVAESRVFIKVTHTLNEENNKWVEEPNGGYDWSICVTTLDKVTKLKASV